jgi:hypothetical protein
MNYWTCSKFADWLRGTASPKSASSKAWNEWARNAKLAHPFRYWLAEDALSKAEEIITAPKNMLYSAKYWFINRYVAKTHALTSNLKKGQWREFDTRLLHCTFDSLVNFVEIEQASHFLIWMSKEQRVQYNAPFHAFGFWRAHAWRSASAGVAHLNWQAKLIMTFGLPSDPDYGMPTQQAVSAIEILDLYYWWKNIYPARPDVHEASGWNAICDKQRTTSSDDFLLDFENEEDRALSKQALELSDQIERRYEDEDTQMLIRLIRVRKSMWT